MAVGCGATCAKVVLITFNFLFWLSGVALLVLGVWIVADPDVDAKLRAMEDVADGPIAEGVIVTKYLAFALIAIGGLIFVIGFLGCCGALKEDKCLLGLYLVFLIVIAGAEIAAGVLAFIRKDTLIGYKIGERVNNSTDPAVQSAWEYVKKKMECTGTNDCVPKLQKWVEDNAPILFGVAIGFGSLEIFGIIFAICLCRAIGEKDD